MKKIFYTLFYLLPLITIAQPTLTQSALPVPGLVYSMGNDTMHFALTPGGASQTWDYSTMLNIGSDTTGFISSTGTLYQASFPTSNLATYDVSSDTWGYFSANSTGFYANGIAGSGTPTGTPLTLSPPELYAPVPFTYNDSITNISRIVVDTVIMSFNSRFVINIKDIFKADGWGTLILPSGTYNNVLRAKVIQRTWDSLYYDPFSTGNYVPVPTAFYTPTVSQNTIYRFAQNQQPFYLLGITADSLGDTAIFSKHLISYIILGNNEIAEQKIINAYPNPASHIVSFSNDLNTEGLLVVRNTLGQEIEKRNISNGKLISIDVENYSNGIYQFSLVSNTDKSTGRFTVRH